MPISAEEHKRAFDLLSGCGRVLCLSHTRPDGDAIGSVLGLRSLLRGVGVDVTGVMLDPPTSRYEWLLVGDPLAIWTTDAAAIRDRSYDAVILVDTCAARQLEPVMPFVKQLSAPRVVFDHHATRDVPAGVLLIDETAAATCELICEWADAVGLTPSAEAATALFAGLATDTGWFRFPSVDARALRTAERLVALGADPHRIYERLYSQDAPGRLRLLGAMLATLELRAGGRLAVVELTQESFRRNGATPADTEDLINEPQRIAGVMAAVLFVEQDDGRVRVSFRSKRDLDVAALAAEFGGGGHARAAGARVVGSLPEVRERVLQRVESCLSHDT
jgi:phosphoesterase RecJ-like protein